MRRPIRPKDWNDLLAEIARLRAREAELVEALEPFARYADEHDKARLPDTAGVAYLPGTGLPTVTVADFRRARAALARVRTEKGETT